MYYLKNEKTGEYVASIIKLRGENSYAVYFKDEPGCGSRWATEKGAQDALSRLLDCERTNPIGVALDLIVVDPEEKEEVAHMNEMTTAQERTPARSLIDIEADIRLQKNVIGEGYVKIGLALIEAKEQLNHGAWANWLRERVNFSQSSAEGYMRVAREYGSGSKLLNLPYTKVLALLAVPAEERETFATENDVEDKSVSEIKRLIRERDEALKAAEAAKAQSEKDQSYFNKLMKLNDRKDNEIMALERQLEKERAKEPDTVTIEKVVPPEDYADLQFKVHNLERQADTLARRAAMAEEELEETRDSLFAAKQENEELRQTQETPDPLDVIPFREACSALLNRLYSAPFAGDFFKTRTDAELEQYSMSVALIMEWSVKTQDTIENIRNERSGFADPFDMAI